MDDWRSYEVYQCRVGRKRRFATVLRVDGYWVQTCLSKSRRQAERKGRDHVSKNRQRDRTRARLEGAFKSRPKTNATGLIWIGESG